MLTAWAGHSAVQQVGFQGWALYLVPSVAVLLREEEACSQLHGLLNTVESWGETVRVFFSPLTPGTADAFGRRPC